MFEQVKKEYTGDKGVGRVARGKRVVAESERKKSDIRIVSRSGAPHNNL